MDDFMDNEFYDEAWDLLQGSGSPRDEGDDSMVFIIGLAHAVGIALLFYFGCKCWRRKTPGLDDDKELTAEPEHLQPKKRLLTGYMLWLTGGLVGAHHFYLDRLVHGLMATYSLNFMFVGWLLDLFLLPYYVRNFNSRRVDASAPLDGSRRQLCCKLPVLLISVVALIGGVTLRLPWALHRTGLIDIDRLAAQTEKNPYEVLGISRGADLLEARSAYRKISLKWHPDRNPNCGKECDHMMSEITKAFDLIKQRKANVWADMTWESWLKDVGRDWWSVLEILSAKWNKEDAKQGPGKPKGRDRSRKSSAGRKGQSEL